VALFEGLGENFRRSREYTKKERKHTKNKEKKRKETKNILKLEVFGKYV